MTTVIDYAAPMMRIEKLMKEMHNDLLDKNLSEAFSKATLMIVEARLLCNTIVIMKEKEDTYALRQQAPTLQERVSTADSAGGDSGQVGTPESTAGFGQERH